MKVGLNTALYNAQGVDLVNVEKNISDILSSATKQEPKVQAIDYSKFNRASLGIDLYSSRTNVNLQKQIAMNQAGLYVQSVNVAELNSKAALSLYSASNLQNNVSKMQSVNDNELTQIKPLEKIDESIQVEETTDKNANFSNSEYNPFAKADNNIATNDERAN